MPIPFMAVRSSEEIASAVSTEGFPLIDVGGNWSRESGGTLHVVVVGVNRIGKVCS